MITSLNPGQKIILIQIVDQIAVRQIERLAAVLQIINDQNITDPSGVQTPYDVAADEAGATGNNNHIAIPSETRSLTRRSYIAT